MVSFYNLLYYLKLETIDTAKTTTIINSGSVGIGINSVVASSILDIGGTTKGSRPFPSLTTTQRDAIATPANGLFAYNTTLNRLDYYNGSAWGAVNSNFFTQALTNTAFITHTDNFGFEITGTGAKRLYSTNGTYNNSLIVNPTGTVISATDGTNTANINALGGGNLVLNSSTGNYLIDTAPDKDSDAAGDVQLRNGSGFLNSVDREAFEVLTGATNPVDGTTTAYEVGQLYINNASPSNPVVWFAHVKSTDPDVAATGSVWQKLYKDTMYMKLTPISKSTAITTTGELEGDYFTIDNTLAGWELDQITYAVTGNTATTGTMQMGLRRYNSSNSAVSISGLATFSTTDTRKTASPGITVVEGDYYVLIVNSESFDNDATGMTATIRLVK